MPPERPDRLSGTRMHLAVCSPCLALFKCARKKVFFTNNFYSSNFLLVPDQSPTLQVEPEVLFDAFYSPSYASPQSTVSMSGCVFSTSKLLKFFINKNMLQISRK